MTSMHGRASRSVWLLALALFVTFGAFAVASSRASAQKQPAHCADGLDNDKDGLFDTADPGCKNAFDQSEDSDSPYDLPRIQTVAVPVVTIEGSVFAGGAINVSRFRVQAAKGSVVEVRCGGGRCPFNTRRLVMKTTSLRLTMLERKLRPRLTLFISIARPGDLGKYLKYAVRKNKPPTRTDSCVLAEKVRDCFKASAT